jgi:branched-chain amino acid transport system substrate-binding protein
MRRNWPSKTLIIVFVPLLFILSWGPCFSQDTTGLTKDTIKIGQFGSLTGETYIFGKLAFNGADLVYNEVNDKGGIHGRKIITVREDDMCKPEGAISAAKKLIHQHKVFMIHGGCCSGAAIAASEEIKNAKVPWMMMDATSDKITEPVHPYVFRATLSARVEGRNMVDFALSNPKVKRIALVGQRDSWGMSKYNPLLERLKELKIEPVADEEMTVDAHDATPQVLRVMKEKADAVLLVLYPKATAVFIRDAIKFGYKPMYVSQTGVTDLLALQDEIGIKGALDDFYTINHTKYGVYDPAVEKWRVLLQKNYPGDRLSVFNLVGIGTAQVVVEALKRAGSDLTREKLRDAMESIKNLEVEMLTAPITFTPTDHQGLKQIAWTALRGGKEVVVGIKYPTK